MSDMASAKFTTTTQGHTHQDSPKVFVGPSLPIEGMKRGDIWIYAAPVARTQKP